MFYAFANGAAWATPLTDASGAAISNPTPVHFGVLQDISVEMSRDAKPLYGTRRHAIDMGGGKEKITVKVKYAQLNAALLSIYTGQSTTTAQDGIVRDLTGTAIPASSPYTITPTVPNTGTWSQDLGVIDANGVAYVRVGSAPATGQYSLANGVYTFAAADTGKTVYISFKYTASSTTAKRQIMTNLPMSLAPRFRLDLFGGQGGLQLPLTLFAVAPNKLSIATKQDDWVIAEMDGEGFSDPSGNVLQWGSPE